MLPEPELEEKGSNFEDDYYNTLSTNLPSVFIEEEMLAVALKELMATSPKEVDGYKFGSASCSRR